MKNKEKKHDFRKSWVFNATKEELDNCICCDYDGKGVSCCGFPCPVHGKTPNPKKKEKIEKIQDVKFTCWRCGKRHSVKVGCSIKDILNYGKI